MDEETPEYDKFPFDQVLYEQSKRESRCMCGKFNANREAVRPFTKSCAIHGERSKRHGQEHAG